ncbi:MAG: BlaI/MecI/CopY family transcriptional regulator [Oscillospiraceae bacterium]|nr:BlaI/MecI/CopY family transcriptional regulator [Oscillospiraceae bacterium]
MVKLFESERKAMELVWENEGATAKVLSALAGSRIGWSKNTTYTVLTKLVEKQIVRREEPGFRCWSAIPREEAAYSEAASVVNAFFGGSVKSLFASFLAKEKISEEELSELREIIDRYQTDK